MQFAGAGHIHPQGHAAVLNQDGGRRVLKDDIVLRVAPVELGLNLGVQIVVGILGLPVAAGHAQGVLDRAVGDNGAGAQFRHQDQLLPVIAAVGVQAVLKGRPDVQLAVGTAKLDQFLQLEIVLFYVGVGRHGNHTIHNIRR